MSRGRQNVWRKAALAVAFLIFGLSSRGHAATPTEAELKAVLLFHLTQFVTWPGAATNGSSEFVIGILGPDPFGPALENVVQGETVDGKPIRIVRANRVRNLPVCQIVYVSPQFRDPLSRAFEDLRHSPTLTVGESPDFLDEGGMICFKKTPEHKIRLQINLTRARADRFNLSAQLLRVSDVVQGGGK